jgi:hypothetical protein
MSLKASAAIALFVVSACFATGCSGGKAARNKEQTAFPAVPAEVSLEMIKGYRDWQRAVASVNTEAHISAIKDVYVNDEGIGSFRSGELPFPAGSIIVKENFEPLPGGEKGSLIALTAMVKMNPGYNPAGGDWAYIQTDPGFAETTLGKLEKCASCHAAAADKDFVFLSRTKQP